MVSPAAAAGLLYCSANRIKSHPPPAVGLLFGYGNFLLGLSAAAASPPPPSPRVLPHEPAVTAATGPVAEEATARADETKGQEENGEEEVMVLTNRLCRRSPYRLALRADGAVRFIDTAGRERVLCPLAKLSSLSGEGGEGGGGM